MLRDIAGAEWRETAEDLGWVAIEASRLEFAVAVFFHELMGATGPDPAIMGQGWEFIRRRCDGELDSRIRGDGGGREADSQELELWPRAERSLRRADKLMIRRNNALHASWGPTWDDHAHQGWLYKRGAKPLVTNWTRSDFEQLQRDLDAAVTVFQQLTARLPPRK